MGRLSLTHRMGHYRIENQSLAEVGKRKIDWAEEHMPVLASLGDKYRLEKPLEGIRVCGCLHVTKETGVLIRTLKSSGAELSWCGCNPLSTQDDVAASIAIDEGISIYASRGVTTDQYYEDIHSTMKIKPNVTIDDGADLTVEVHRFIDDFRPGLYGGTEETTTGVVRLRALQKVGKLMYPIFAVNDAETKQDFDNFYGTGQSALDGIIRATNILLSGKNVVVAGYGHVGKGIAKKAAGLGANVTITEIDPISALKAKLDGFTVSTMKHASLFGDVFITTTGCRDVIGSKAIKELKDGAILANAGHFNVEISVPELERQSVNKSQVNDNIVRYNLNHKKVYLIGEGRLVNLVAADGHPSEVMDMSFANQFLSVLKIAESKGSLQPLVYTISREQDQEIALAKLKSMNVEIDTLTADQKTYLDGFSQGT